MKNILIKRRAIAVCLALLASRSIASADSPAAKGASDRSLPPVFIRNEFNRDAFLALIDRETPPKIHELKRFYVRPQAQPDTWSVVGNRAKMIELGKLLFFDPRISKGGKLACSTCHMPEKHWVDGLPMSTEGNSRRSMSLYNLAWDRKWTWNGSANALMTQATMALGAPKGMGINSSNAARLIQGISGYEKPFKDAFNIPGAASELRDPVRLLAALEAFVRTIVSPTAPFDRWIKGDEGAISKAAKRGFLIFNGKAQCAQCHNSWRFSDGNVYDIGLITAEATGPKGETIKFNTHTKAVGLREIADRPPYTSLGQFKTLQEMIEFYNRGGNFPRPSQSKHVRPLGLTVQEQRDLLAFLKTLSSGPNRFKPPRSLPR